MADRYDPKLPVRPLSERKPAQPSSEEDPLVELARIVSGRSTFDPAPAPRNKTVPAGPSPDLSITNDLESELLNDLQASFALIREPAAAAPPQPKPTPAAPKQPAPMPAAAKPAPLPPAAKPAAAPVSAKPAQPVSQQPKPAVAAQKPAAIPSAPPSQPAEQPARAEKPAARPAAVSQPARMDQPQRAEKPAAPPAPAPARAERPQQPAAPERAVIRPVDRGDFAKVPLRPTTPAHAPEPAPAPQAQASARWEKSEDKAPVAGDAKAFAPPRAKNWFRPQKQERPQPQPEPGAELLDHEPFDEGPPASFAEEEQPFDEFALEDIAAYGDDENELPPLVDELPDMGHRRPARGLIVGAAVLALVLVGGIAYFLLGGTTGTTTPPVITADATPTKIAPPASSDGSADQQNKLIYDRVDGGSPPSETKLVTPGSEQIANVQTPSEEESSNPVSRVIIQGGPGVDAPPADGAPAAAADAAPSSPADDNGAGEPPAASSDDGLGPRKVRTVVVRPDGTIVSSEAAPADGNPAAAAEPGAADPSKPPSEVAGSLNLPASRTDMDKVLDKGGSIPVNADPLANGGAAAPADGAPAANGSGDGAAAPPAPGPVASAAPPAPAGTVPAGDAGDAQPQPPSSADAGAKPAAPDASADSSGDAAAAAPEPPVKPAAKPAKPVVVARGDPIDLTPASKPAKAPASAAASGSGSGLSVQVTSQKTQDGALAAYRGLQSRYPAVLGRYQPNLQKADLGDRGTYYRVRVGPFAGDGAQRVCTALKEAGGDCIIVR